MNTTLIGPKVGFLFYTTGKEWHGGKNYYRALFGALDMLPDRCIQPVALLGHKTDVKELMLPSSVEVVRDSSLDRFSLAWMVDKFTERAIGRPILLRRALQRHGINLISHTGSIGVREIRSIGWIPDFQHMHLPSFFSKKELASRTALYQGFLSKCDRIVLSSHAAQDDLADFSPAHAEKGRVLRFCSVRPQVNAAAMPDVRRIYGLDQPFLYMPNQVWAHKNHAVVVEALARLRDGYPTLKVVCSGALSDYRNPHHLRQLRERIEALGLSSRFLMMGMIPYDHIAPLMLEAIAVINPSFFEGWATTVEEAKTLGVPLILSNLKVHREQCSNGEAVFFDPKDPEALALLMADSLSSPAFRINDEVRLVRMQAALESHHERSEVFARTYQDIVMELAHSSCNIGRAPSA